MWATQRQLLIALGILVVLVAVGVGGYFALIYKAPMCTDGVQNGTEEGIDCGGICTNLCAMQAPNISVEWARSVRVAPGVYHAVALIKNPDTTAAGSFPYKVSLYDASNILIAEKSGIFMIGPGEEAPLFEPTIETGARVPVRTFVDVGAGMWQRTTRTVPPLTVSSFVLDATSTSLSAVLQNDTAAPIADAEVTALLYNKDGLLITASQTTTGLVPARGTVTISFTWPEPFSESPQHIDIIPHVR